MILDNKNTDKNLFRDPVVLIFVEVFFASCEKPGSSLPESINKVMQSFFKIDIHIKRINYLRMLPIHISATRGR